MNRDRLVIGLAGVASCARAVWAWDAGHAETPDEAHFHMLALHAAQSWSKLDLGWIFQNLGVVLPNPQIVPIWSALWMALFGMTSRVALAALLPFHLLAAHGLWRGGKEMGGLPGAAFALGAGLGATGPLVHGQALLLDFPMFGCVAFAAGALVERRWAAAAWGLALAAGVKLAALPVLAVLAGMVLWGAGREGVSRAARILALPALFTLALYLPNLGALADYARSSGAAGTPSPLSVRLSFHVGSVIAEAGPALLLGLIGGLLGRGDSRTLQLLGAAAGVILGLLPLSFFAQVRYALPVVPLLAIAGAGSGRWVVAALGALAAVQLVGAHTDREGWPGLPAALRETEGSTYDVDPLLDWIVAHRPAGSASPEDGAGFAPTRVALHLAGSERLHFGLFAVRAIERSIPMEIVVVDDHRPLEQDVDLGIVIAQPGRPTARQGWRDQLPPPSETRSWPDGLVVQLWDRPLPPETLLASPEEAEKRNHPRQQALYAWLDGAEHGPLLPEVSSVQALPDGPGTQVLFVRGQALWRARSADGLTFDEPTPLRDADGPIRAVDPAAQEQADGSWRLFAAEIVGDPEVDPANVTTRIVSWRGASLDTLVREPGARIEGVGLVDPSPSPDGRTLYLTQARSRVVSATSPDGLAFTLSGVVAAGYTVPEVYAGGMLAQANVMGWSVLQVAKDAGFRSLELCGTGASLSRNVLYYTRSADTCPPAIALPERRDLLNSLTRTAP